MIGAESVLSMACGSTLQSPTRFEHWSPLEPEVVSPTSPGHVLGQWRGGGVVAGEIFTRRKGVATRLGDSSEDSAVGWQSFS